MDALFFLQFRHELTKMFARKRTYIGFGAFLALETLVLIGLNRPGPRRAFQHMIESNGFGFDRYFSGLTLGFMMLYWTALLLGGLFLALVAGDVVSKEVEEGTMRMMLCRPVTRGRVVALKYAACVTYTFAMVAFIGLTALAAGLAYRGWGGLFAFAPLERVMALYEPGEGLERYFLALALLACSLTTISSLGFMLSCMKMKPVSATVVTVTVLFADNIFRNVPLFDDLKVYFVTAHLATWINAFHNRIPWRDVAMDLAYLGAVDATFLIVGLVVFARRDFKA
ncbi:MAG: ABC transporter permease [Gluconacetobacter diazotrophicus]|nr:ABC transporter permease [Gluconacetobacter diazotrophicus]